MGRLVEAAGPSLFFNMTTRNADGKSFTFAYDAENRLVSVSGDSTATFTFNGDGQRVKSVMDGETTLVVYPEPRRRVGGHYQITNPGAGQTLRIGCVSSGAFICGYNFQRR